jgi:CRP-like cAMP-binding protein
MPTLDSLFSSQVRPRLAEALPLFETHEVPAGAVLMTEGEVSEGLLFVETGRVVLSSGGVPLKTLEAGSLLGEISLFGHGTRTVTATAEGRVVYRALRREGYEALRGAEHPVAWELEMRACSALAGRLQELAAEIGEVGRRSHLVEIKPGRLAVGQPQASTPQRIASMLSRIPGFEDFDPAWLRTLAEDFAVRTWREGEHLSTAAHGTLGFVLVASGEIERFAATEDTRGVRLAVWGPGAMAGLAGLLDPRPIRGFVLAASPVTALVAQQSVFQRWYGAAGAEGSWFRAALLRELGNQVTNANATQSMLRLLQR